ncbi:MAG: DUF4783 domain-containing protein [Bacteroidales bacterium]
MTLTIFITHLLSLFLSGSPAEGFTAEKVPQAIVTAMKTGNYRELGRYFNSSVELVVLENENVYSKSQAELIIRDFFAKYTPTGFVVRHEEAREGLCYAIGKLSTKNGEFRVVILLKTKDGNSLIHQLRIEKDSGND